jgi:YbbR domain-containing protein
MHRLAHNWILKLTSLVLAIGLWSHVREQVNPWEIASFRTRLVVDAPAGFVLQNAEDVPRTVTVMMRGPHLTLRQLKGGAPSNPLASGEDAPLLTTSSVRATLDFSSPHRGEQKVPVKVETKLEDVEVVGAKPNEIAVKLDTAARRKVAVKAHFDLPSVWRVIDVELGAKRAEVSGASQALARVKNVRASIAGKISAPGPLQFERVRLEAVDEDGEVVPGLEIEPSTIRVRATIAERQVEKTVPVEVQLSGEVARGYVAGEAQVEPARVTLRGAQSALAKITSIEAPLDLHDAQQDIVRRVHLTAPAGTEFVSSRSVLIRVPVTATISRALSTPDAATNLTPPVDTSGLPKPALRR